MKLGECQSSNRKPADEGSEDNKGTIEPLDALEDQKGSDIEMLIPP